MQKAYISKAQATKMYKICYNMDIKNKRKVIIHMTMYKIKDILDIANNLYNLKINFQKDSKEIATIEKAIRRALQARGVTAPYKCTKDQAYYLINYDMKKYFLNKSAKKNPDLFLDSDAFNEAVKENLSRSMSYQEALINCKLDYLIQLLGSNDHQSTFFNAVDFTKAYIEYRNHLDENGFPMPGFTKAESTLKASKKFFTVLPIPDKPFQPEKKKD